MILDSGSAKLCPSKAFSFALRIPEIWWNIEHKPFTWSTHRFKPCIDSLLQKERGRHGVFFLRSILWRAMILKGWKTCRFPWGLVYSASGFNKGKELLKSSFHLAPGTCLVSGFCPRLGLHWTYDFMSILWILWIFLLCFLFCLCLSSLS